MVCVDLIVMFELIKYIMTDENKKEVTLTEVKGSRGGYVDISQNEKTITVNMDDVIRLISQLYLDSHNDIKQKLFRNLFPNWNPS